MEPNGREGILLQRRWRAPLQPVVQRLTVYHKYGLRKHSVAATVKDWLVAAALIWLGIAAALLFVYFVHHGIR